MLGGGWATTTAVALFTGLSALRLVNSSSGCNIRSGSCDASSSSVDNVYYSFDYLSPLNAQNAFFWPFDGVGFPITAALTSSDISTVTSLPVHFESLSYNYDAVYERDTGSSVWKVASFVPSTDNQLHAIALRSAHSLQNIEQLLSQINGISAATDNSVITFTTTDNSSFKFNVTTLGTDGQPTGLPTISLFDVESDSYFADGSFQSLGDSSTSSAQQIEVVVLRYSQDTIAVVFPQTGSQHAMVLQYNVQDGYVNRDDFVAADIPADQSAPVEKLVSIVRSAQQLVFESDGSIQFIKDNGASRFVITPQPELSNASPDDDLLSGVPVPLAAGTPLTASSVFTINGSDALLGSDASAVDRVGLTLESIGSGTAVIALDGKSHEVFTFSFDQSTGAVSNVSISSSTASSGSFAGDELAETNLHNIFQIASSFQEQSDGKIVITAAANGYQVTLNPVQASASYSISATPATFDFDGYTLQGAVQNLFPDTPDSDLPTFAVSAPASGQYQVTLNGASPVTYAISYDPSDNKILSVVPSGTPSSSEDATDNLIRSATNVSFEADSGILVLENSDANTRLRLRLASSPLVSGSSELPAHSTLDVVADSYYFNGAAASLFDGSSSFPITVQLDQGDVEGSLNVTLHAINTFKYTFTYSPSDGTVSQITPTYESKLDVTTEESTVESRLENLLANTQQISFQQDGRVVFTASGGSHIAFEPSHNRRLAAVERLNVAAETYFVNGAFANLYQGTTSFPITVDIERTGVGAVDVTLRGVGSSKYSIAYNNADGWVSRITPVNTNNQQSGNAAQQAAETRLKNIIANTQQIAFERDGRVQFITDNGSTRISFDPSTHRRLFNVDKFSIAPESYMVRGASSNLFDGATSFPVNIQVEHKGNGLMDVSVQGINTCKFSYSYNTADGWVSKITPGASTNTQVTQAQKNVESRLKDMFSHVQQIAFEPDGRVQFIHDHGESRVSFVPASTSTGSSSNSASQLHLSLAPDTYFVNGSAGKLYDGLSSTFPITIDVTRSGVGSADVTVHAINTFKYSFAYNNADGWVSRVTAGSSTGQQLTSAQQAVESRIRDLLSNTQQIAFEQNGRVQFIGNNGATRVGFDPSQSSSHGSPQQNAHGSPQQNAHGSPQQNAQGSPQQNAQGSHNGSGTLAVVPETYFFRGSFANLYEGTSSFPITVEVQTRGVGTADVTVHAVNTFTYSFSYNNADGWVSKITPGFSTSIQLSFAQQAVESRIKNIIANTQQLAFERDGRVQFITDNGSTRISFDPSVRHRNLFNTERLSIAPETYFFRGSFANLYEGSSTFPITIDVESVGVGAVDVTLRAVNTIRYSFAYNNADGWVSRITPGTASNVQLTSAQQAVESRVKNILANTQQIAFERDGRIQFITDNGSTRVSFDPSSSSSGGGGGNGHSPNGQRHLAATDRLAVVPETYFYRGSFANLYEGSSTFPITVDVSRTGVGAVDVTIRAINTYNYSISYNNADGWVSSIKPGRTTNVQTTTAQQAVESRIVNIVANTQQIAFEQNGRVQFITDNGSTRVSFDPSYHRRLYGTEQLSIAADTYFFRGSFANLFDGSSTFPITIDVERTGVGAIDVTLRAINTIKYSFAYNNADGWVSRITPGYTTSVQLTSAQQAVESRVKNIMANTQQIAFEQNGRIQFITDNGSTRVSFDPSSSSRGQQNNQSHSSSSRHRSLQATERLAVVPETYFFRGSFANLYEGGNSFPITIDLQRTGVGAVDVTLRAVNTIRYSIAYNNADGWVSRITPGHTTSVQLTSAQQAVESRIKNIIANTQQIAFERDGRVQFITDNGSTRISFDPSHHRRLYGTEHLSIAADTYTFRGSFANLFEGSSSFPITIDVERTGVGAMEVTVRAINTFKYSFAYNNADGWVSRITPGYTSNLQLSSAQQAVESRIKNLMANTQQIAFERDGRIQFITDNGSTRVSFDPSSSSAGNSHANHRGEFSLAPDTFYVNGQFDSVLRDRNVPTTVTLNQPSSGRAEVTLRTGSSGSATYDITFNAGDGKVSAIALRSGSTLSSSQQQRDVEERLRNIFGNVQQLSFEQDGRVQFLTNSGNTRVGFVPVGSQRRLAASAATRLSVVPETYYVNGSFANLFDGTTSFPITIDVDQRGVGAIDVTVHAISTFRYSYAYNNADGWVSKVTAGSSNNAQTTHAQQAVETRLKNILANTQQIAFEKDGRIQFITNNGNTRISFDPSSSSHGSTRNVAPDTYYVNGQFDSFLRDRNVPATVDVRETGVGRVEVTLKTGQNGSAVYDIAYNNADGWVSSITPRSGATQSSGQQREVEDRLRNLIGNTQQIAFESDGRIQFINNNGNTRVSFDPSSSHRKLSSANRSSNSSTRNVAPDTYYVNGQFDSFLRDRNVPATVDVRETGVGRVEVTLKTGQNGSAVYDIAYNNADGWVSSITPRSGATQSSGQQREVEDRLRNLIGNTQQIAFESDGRIQFINNNGNTRVSFDPTSGRGRHLQAASTSRFLDNSHFLMNGHQVSLGSNQPTFTLDLTQSTESGRADFWVHGSNSAKFVVLYDPATGNVNKVETGYSTSKNNSNNSDSIERQIWQAIQSAQQFRRDDQDGTVSFFSNNNQNEVRFRPTTSNSNNSNNSSWNSGRGGNNSNSNSNNSIDSLFQSGSTFDVVASSYQRNRVSEGLFSGSSFPITVRIVEHNRSSGRLVLQLQAVSVNQFEFNYNVGDGTVRSISPSVVSVGTGTADRTAAETKLKNVIANTNQLTFGADGRLQFITDGGATRVSFDRTSGGRHLQSSNSDQPRTIVPATYFVNGSFQPLFTSSYYTPITVDVTTKGVGEVDVALHAVNTRNYTIKYNNADGWVSSVTTRGQTSGSSSSPGSADLLDAERKIDNIIANVNQLAFEQDGRLQFIANNGNTRISFDPTTPTSGNRIRSVIPGTYQVQGAQGSLFDSSNSYSPFSLNIVNKSSGSVQLDLRGPNNTDLSSYLVTYSPTDGGVSSVSALRQGTASASSPQGRIDDLIKNLNKLSFDQDGSVQIISNNNSRITFF